MAFDAGSIEATLDLNRNPFTAGLAAARSQAQAFARNTYTATIKVNVDHVALNAVEKQLKNLAGKTYRATAKVLVDRLHFDKLLKDLRAFDRRVYRTRVSIDTRRATRDVIAFRTLLASLTNATVTLSTRTRAFGGAASDGFGRGASHFTRMASLIIGTLPLIASGFTAAVGGVGALASSFLIAGLGAGAFALVAVPAFKQIKAAVAGGEAEIRKLPPAFQATARTVQQIVTEFGRLQKATEGVVGTALHSWAHAALSGLKTLQPLVVASAEAFAVAGNRVREYFESPSWGRFVQWLSHAMTPAVDMLFRGIIALIRIVGNLTRAFWALGGSQIMEMIVSGLERFAEYTERIGENQSFQHFMEAAVRSFPVVANLIGEVVEFLFKLATGLEPLGTLIFRVLSLIFDGLNKMPPEYLGALALGFAAVWAAIALGATGPVGLAIGALAALAVLFANAYEKNEAFRQSLERLFQPIKDWFIPLTEQLADIWEQKVLPAWDRVVAATREHLLPVLEDLWKKFQDQVLPALNSAAITFTDVLLPAILDFWAAIQPFVAWVVKAFGEEIIYVLELLFRAFDGTFQMIAGVLDVFIGIFTGDWERFTQGITRITEGFWTIVAGIFGMSLEDLKHLFNDWDKWLNDTWTAFWAGIERFIDTTWENIKKFFSDGLEAIRSAVDIASDRIGQAWRKVANFFRDPINWVINVVINDGILRAWNAVMGWIGAPGLSVGRVPEIPAFSRGGVMPGYAPRQDSLLAAVSPGESIMVPEWTRMVGGPDAVRRMNDAAMSGGMYYEGNPRGYSLGGVIPPSLQFAYGGVAPHVAAAGDEIRRVFGNMPIGGVGARANASDHPSGFALDFMVGRSLGDRIANYFFANWGRLATKYIIWLQRIASSPWAWRGMADRGSPTANHMDHVHASFLGGPGGGAAAPVMVSWWSIIADKVKSLFSGIFGGDIPGVGGAIGEAIERIPAALIDKVISKIQEKLSSMMTVLGSTPALDAAGGSNTSLGFGTADRGALIPPGRSTIFNATGRAEPLVNYDLYRKMNPGVTVDEVIALLREWDGGGRGGDTYNVMLPPQASVRELADQLDFKRRVVSKGRYGR